VGDWKVFVWGCSVDVVVEVGLVVEDVEMGWCGVVVCIEKVGGVYVVYLEDWWGCVCGFLFGFGFLFDGCLVVFTVFVAAVVVCLIWMVSGLIVV